MRLWMAFFFFLSCGLGIVEASSALQNLSPEQNEKLIDLREKQRDLAFRMNERIKKAEEDHPEYVEANQEAFDRMKEAQKILNDSSKNLERGEVQSAVRQQTHFFTSVSDLFVDGLNFMEDKTKPEAAMMGTFLDKMEGSVAYPREEKTMPGDKPLFEASVLEALDLVSNSSNQKNPIQPEKESYLESISDQFKKEFTAKTMADLNLKNIKGSGGVDKEMKPNQDIMEMSPLGNAMGKLKESPWADEARELMESKTFEKDEAGLLGNGLEIEATPSSMEGMGGQREGISQALENLKEDLTGGLSKKEVDAGVGASQEHDQALSKQLISIEEENLSSEMEADSGGIVSDYEFSSGGQGSKLGSGALGSKKGGSSGATTGALDVEQLQAKEVVQQKLGGSGNLRAQQAHKGGGHLEKSQQKGNDRLNGDERNKYSGTLPGLGGDAEFSLSKGKKKMAGESVMAGDKLGAGASEDEIGTTLSESGDGDGGAEKVGAGSSSGEGAGLGDGGANEAGEGIGKEGSIGSSGAAGDGGVEQTGSGGVAIAGAGASGDGDSSGAGGSDQEEGSKFSKAEAVSGAGDNAGSGNADGKGLGPSGAGAVGNGGAEQAGSGSTASEGAGASGAGDSAGAGGFAVGKDSAFSGAGDGSGGAEKSGSGNASADASSEAGEGNNGAGESSGSGDASKSAGSGMGSGDSSGAGAAGNGGAEQADSGSSASEGAGASGAGDSAGAGGSAAGKGSAFSGAGDGSGGAEKSGSGNASADASSEAGAGNNGAGEGLGGGGTNEAAGAGMGSGDSSGADAAGNGGAEQAGSGSSASEGAGASGAGDSAGAGGSAAGKGSAFSGAGDGSGGAEKSGSGNASADASSEAGAGNNGAGASLGSGSANEAAGSGMGSGDSSGAGAAGDGGAEEAGSGDAANAGAGAGTGIGNAASNVNEAQITQTENNLEFKKSMTQQTTTLQGPLTTNDQTGADDVPPKQEKAYDEMTSGEQEKEAKERQRIVKEIRDWLVQEKLLLEELRKIKPVSQPNEDNPPWEFYVLRQKQLLTKIKQLRRRIDYTGKLDEYYLELPKLSDFANRLLDLIDRGEYTQYEAAAQAYDRLLVDLRFSGGEDVHAPKAKALSRQHVEDQKVPHAYRDLVSDYLQNLSET